MAEIHRVHLFARTRDESQAGTKDRIGLVINAGGSDFVNATLRNDDNFTRNVDGGASHITRSPSGSPRLESADLDASSIRIFVGGNDRWRPEHIALIGSGFQRAVIPLACVLDSNANLSADPAEGSLSMRLPLLATTDYDTTVIHRLLILVDTLDYDYAGTDSPVRLECYAGGSKVLDHTFTDTAQSDFERGFSNLHLLRAATPFTRPPGPQAFRATLFIEGEDQWRPSTLLMFGVATESGTPDRLIPLVANWDFDWALSQKNSEGISSLNLRKAW